MRPETWNIDLSRVGDLCVGDGEAKLRDAVVPPAVHHTSRGESKVVTITTADVSDRLVTIAGKSVCAWCVCVYQV